MVTELTGSIGGVAFQRNRSGTIARIKSSTPKKASVKQSVRGSLFTAKQQVWATLTAAQQDVWNVYALANPKLDRWNVAKNLSGLNWFTSVNMSLDLAGQPNINAPGAFTIIEPWITDSFVVTQNEIKITSGFTVDDLNKYALFYLTPPLRRTTTSFRKDLRFVSAAPFEALSPYPLTASWESVYGVSWPPSSVSLAFKIGIMVVMVNVVTGLTSAATFEIEPYTVVP